MPVTGQSLLFLQMWPFRDIPNLGAPSLCQSAHRFPYQVLGTDRKRDMNAGYRASPFAMDGSPARGTVSSLETGLSLQGWVRDV